MGGSASAGARAGDSAEAEVVTAEGALAAIQERESLERVVKASEQSLADLDAAIERHRKAAENSMLEVAALEKQRKPLERGLREAAAARDKAAKAAKARG